MRLTVPRHPAWNTPTARLLGIYENDRQAIGSLDAEKNTGRAGDEAIADQRFFRHAGDAVDEVGMNLTQRDQRPRLLAGGSAEPEHKGRPVPFDCGARILFGESKIESASTINARRTAESGAESVNQPGNASEDFRTKDGQSRSFGRLYGH